MNRIDWNLQNDSRNGGNIETRGKRPSEEELDRLIQEDIVASGAGQQENRILAG